MTASEMHKFFNLKFSTEEGAVGRDKKLLCEGYQIPRISSAACDPTGWPSAGNCQRTLAPTSFTILGKILNNPDIFNRLDIHHHYIY